MMAKRQQARPKPQWRIVVFGAIMLVALGLGLSATYVAGRHVGQTDTYASALVSQAEIAQDKQLITDQYLAASTKNCVDPTTQVPYDGAAYFKHYLQVNAYGNRATIRPCNSNGVLLAKLGSKWVETEVNLNLSARANPVWSKACYVNDILSPDRIVRPENSSIDADNLAMCQALQHGKILTIQDL